MVQKVLPNTPAAMIGLRAGDEIVSIGGFDINDVLDYQFYTNEDEVDICFTSGDGEIQRVIVEKEADEDFGCEFATYLIDKQHTCRNNCVFCFVDQMPPGLRETLYVKDDDERMSFLFGNYITLTNLEDKDVERILKMHISPINISVHTTDPSLRSQMMGNRFAGDKLRYIRMLADGHIEINAQIVLCPGLNDGASLYRTMKDLATFFPAVSSVSVVPVGLTRYRDDLPALRPISGKEAADLIDQIHAYTDGFWGRHGTRLIYPADELFVLANRPIPPDSYYGEYKQIENGVGMLRTFLDEFEKACQTCDPGFRPVDCDIVTGECPSGYILQSVERLQRRYPRWQAKVHVIQNEFFGGNVTVTGLVTATDIVKQVQGKMVSNRLLVPDCMLRNEKDRFIDDGTPQSVEQSLGCTVQVIDGSGQTFVDAALGVVLP